MKYCNKCNTLKEEDEFYKRARDGYKPYGRCIKCSKEDSSIRFQRYKEEAKAYAGGKCLICGYNKYRGALEFHHLDRKSKSKNYNSMRNWSFNSKKFELDKCVLLCSNCHKEVEAGLVDLSLYLEGSNPSAST